MADAWRLGVVIVGMCAWRYMPDFDPLLVIVFLFGGMALLSHLGLVDQSATGEPERARRTKQRQEQEGGTQAREATSSDLLEDAERCLAQNNWARVQELAKCALDLEPENVRGWELLATALKWEGKREEAAATVQKARDLYELSSKGLSDLAEELRSEVPSDAAAAHLAKAEQFIAKRQYDLAMECFTAALEPLEGTIDDEGSRLRLQILRGRAECAQQLQDWSRCRKDATAVLEADAGDTRALMQRAAANEALEKFSAALDDARKILATDPKNSAANRIAHNCQQALRS